MTFDPSTRSYWSLWWSLLKLTSKKGLGKWPDGREGCFHRVTAKKYRGLGGWGVFRICLCMCVLGGCCHRVKKFPLSSLLLLLLMSTSVSVRLLWLAGQKASNQPALNNVWPLLFLGCFSSLALHRNLLASFVLISLIQRFLSPFPLFYMLFSGFFCVPSISPAELSTGILCSVRMQRASWLDATH